MSTLILSRMRLVISFFAMPACRAKILDVKYRPPQSADRFLILTKAAGLGIIGLLLALWISYV